MKKLKSICLITQDVRRLCDFYATILKSNPEGDDSFVTLSTEELDLSISSVHILQEMAPDLTISPHAGNCFLEFEVEDVDQDYEQLKTLNIVILKPPSTQPWGLRSVWFCDPDGNKLNFFAHVDPS